jgi:hypothetical protein
MKNQCGRNPRVLCSMLLHSQVLPCGYHIAPPSQQFIKSSHSTIQSIFAFLEVARPPSSRTSEPLFLLFGGSATTVLVAALTLFHESKGLALFGFFALFSGTETLTKSVLPRSFLEVERNVRPVGGGVAGVSDSAIFVGVDGEISRVASRPSCSSMSVRASSSFSASRLRFCSSV